MRISKPITVTLGRMQEGVDARIARGDYASVSEVLRAGLRALEREESVLDEIVRVKVQEALDDPRPLVPAEEAFARIRSRIARVQADGGR